jgi:naphthalene 1,2-dioxygenase ferredoxin reductase component
VLARRSSYALRDPGRVVNFMALACCDIGATPVTWLESDGLVLHPQRQLVCRVVALARATHDIIRIALTVEAGGPFRFSAGQYASLRFSDCAPRDYSMANRPDEPVLEFHIRRMGVASASAYVADRLRIGETLTVEGPFGSSYLREEHHGPIIAVAGGSGLAPIKSIVETALAHGSREAIRFYFGARDECDIYLENHFRALGQRHPNLDYTPVLSEPTAAVTRRVGLVHEAIAADLGAVDGAKAYLAGPPPMVEAAAALLASRGLSPADIHADAFYSEAEKQALGRAAITLPHGG